MSDQEQPMPQDRENEHTPLPWQFDELALNPDGCGYIRCQTDTLEISHHGDTGRSREENLANAALIIEAVNSHATHLSTIAAMREALVEKLNADDAMCAFLIAADPKKIGEEEWRIQHKRLSNRGRAADDKMRAAVDLAQTEGK